MSDTLCDLVLNRAFSTDKTMENYIAAIEAGGTKFNCAIFDRNREQVVYQKIDTTTPEETLGNVIDFFLSHQQQYPFTKLGLACFGPLNLDKSSALYGQISSTPKPHWSFTPIVDILSQRLKCQIAFDTDVNAAALAESLWGAAQNTDVCIYVTVGTGLGAGIVIHGRTLKGLVHPEAGHMLLPAPQDIQGQCPFHQNCAEGLVSGRAMEQIWQTPAENLPPEHCAWELFTDVLSAFFHNLIVSYSPQRIVVGGGVMSHQQRLHKTIIKTQTSLAEYVLMPDNMSFEKLIVRPGLSQNAGLLGAVAITTDI